MAIPRALIGLLIVSIIAGVILGLIYRRIRHRSGTTVIFVAFALDYLGMTHNSTALDVLEQ